MTNIWTNNRTCFQPIYNAITNSIPGTGSLSLTTALQKCASDLQNGTLSCSQPSGSGGTNRQKNK